MNLPSFFRWSKSCSTGETEGISLLTGDPRKAILSLSGPMIVAMLLMSSYNIVNAFWVVGLGSDALAAIGLMTPVYMILVGIGTGIGAGATSAISRRIGANDRAGASNHAIHAFIIALVLSIFVALPLVTFGKDLAIIFGAGETADLAAEYGTILFAGSFFIIFVEIAYGILRAEGDTKRVMRAMVAATLLNIILDPVLIYGLGLGIAGAALGTIISLALATIIISFWFFIKRDTYACISWQMFWPEKAAVSDILYVGIPASIEFLMMSVMNIFLNLILVTVATTDAVAVFSIGFRVISFGIVPIIAIGTSVVSVTGAAYGAKLYGKIRTSHSFGILFALGIAVSVSVLTHMFANPIAAIFSYSRESTHLYPEIAAFITVMCFFYPCVAFGLVSSSVFQGVGRGPTSLFLTFMRSFVFVMIFAYTFAIVAGMGEQGVWRGIVAGEFAGGLLAYALARFYIMTIDPRRIADEV